MKIQNLRNVRQPKLMIIPMIDVIFFLLVFFMVGTLYMVEQKTLPVQLPQASSPAVSRERTVPVTVLADGRILFEQEEIPPALLHKRAEIALRRDANAVFVLRSDRKATYGAVVEVLDELKMAGVTRLAIATERKGR